MALRFGIKTPPQHTTWDAMKAVWLVADEVEVIVSLLAQEEADFSGHFFQLTAARCEPKGPQQPHPPIVIGGGGEKRTLRTVARWAQHWNLSFPTPETFKRKYHILLGHCDAVGRDPNDILCSAQLALPVNEAPQASAERAAALADVGCDKVIFSLRPPYRAEIVEPLGRALSDLA